MPSRGLGKACSRSWSASDWGHYYRGVRMPEPPGSSSFTPRTREIARVLAGPFLGDVNLTGRLLHCLKPQNEAARIDRYGEPEWVALYRLRKQ